MSKRKHLRIFAGTAHPKLAEEIANILGVPVGMSLCTKFPDSEIHVEIDEVVRGQDIFFVQSYPTSVNDHYVETLFYLDAFRRASANSVSVVMPYFPYARQDRMANGREAISARVVANTLECLGTRRVIFVDIHNLAIQGFFNIPVDPLSAMPLLASYFEKPEFENAAIVSPDVGRASLAGKYAEHLHLPLVVMQKRRSNGKKVETVNVVGDIDGHRPIIIDDIISGGSVLTQIDKLYERGAVGKACFSITHGVLAPAALELLARDDRIEKLVVTDTLPIPEEKRTAKLEVLCIAPMLAEFIWRIHKCESISPLLIHM